MGVRGGAGVVKESDPTAAAVEPATQLSAPPPDRGLKVPDVLQHGRVRVVVGEGAVRLAVERHHLGADAGEHPLGHETGHTVPAVHHDLYRSRDGTVTLDDRPDVAL